MNAARGALILLATILGAEGRACRGPVGAPCSASSECRSAPVPECRDWPGGYCTGRCMANLDCGSTGACIEADDEGALCLLRCRDDEGCREGYACRGTLEGWTVCLPDRGLATAATVR